MSFMQRPVNTAELKNSTAAMPVPNLLLTRFKGTKKNNKETAIGQANLTHRKGVFLLPASTNHLAQYSLSIFYPCSYFLYSATTEFTMHLQMILLHHSMEIPTAIQITSAVSQDLCSPKKQTGFRDIKQTRDLYNV